MHELSDLSERRVLVIGASGLDVVSRLEGAADPLSEGVAIARETVGWARDLCQGVHLMTLGHEDKIPAILR